tara:strand:- start:2466 stop:3098 length:633 start_codon:yes stop_codon:yes gene_type:complete
MFCLVQARTNSKRLPNKIFKKLGNLTIIERVFLKLRKSKKISKIIFVTSKKRGDDAVEVFCREKGISFFRGSLNDVSLRFLKAVKKYKINAFVRISCDSPLIDHKIIDKAVLIFKKKNKDLVTNIFPRTFPKGQSVEVVKSKILKENISDFKKSQKEHVTKYFYDNYKKFKIFNIRSKKNFLKIRLCVDTKKDLNFLNKNIKKLENITYL